MKTFLASVLCLLCALPAYPQKTTENPLAPLIGVYLMPESELDSAPSTRRGLVLTDAGQIRGFDGCNSFWCDYTYNEKQGFKLDNHVSTLLECVPSRSNFSPSLLYSAKKFSIKGNCVTFYNKEGRETGKLFAIESFEKSQTLPVGEWKLVETNNPFFEAARKENREPYLRIEADRQFVVCYDKEKKGNWRSVNYFAGRCYAGERRFMFSVEASSSVLVMPNGEDAQLAYDLKEVRAWTLKNNRLVLTHAKYQYVFEKL